MLSVMLPIPSQRQVPAYQYLLLAAAHLWQKNMSDCRNGAIMQWLFARHAALPFHVASMTAGSQLGCISLNQLLHHTKFKEWNKEK